MDEIQKEDRKALFQCWLAEMDTTLAAFINLFEYEIGIRLDYSPYSLDDVERWILEKYVSIPEIRKAENKGVLNMLAV